MTERGAGQEHAPVVGFRTEGALQTATHFWGPEVGVKGTGVFPLHLVHCGLSTVPVLMKPSAHLRPQQLRE
jgi:hypothetical protein